MQKSSGDATEAVSQSVSHGVVEANEVGCWPTRARLTVEMSRKDANCDMHKQAFVVPSLEMRRAARYGGGEYLGDPPAARGCRGAAVKERQANQKDATGVTGVR